MNKLHAARWRGVSALAVTLFAMPALAGMLVSGRDPGLAINAWGGARDGIALRLHNGCRIDNRDCNWTYRGGLLYSGDGSSGLAVKAMSRSDGGVVALAAGCQRNVPGCVWIYRDGMFISEGGGPMLAINASGGARYGTTLRLSAACRASNPDCTWSQPR